MKVSYSHGMEGNDMQNGLIHLQNEMPCTKGQPLQQVPLSVQGQYQKP